MEIKLKKLHIRNFKGFKEYGFEPNGDSVNVSGDNGTGKTSLYDAFLWALFGKDSTDKTAFDWKPLDKDNNEINHLETEVEVTLDIDDQEKVLKRTTVEDWVNKRGSIHKTFNGHTTTYQIDGINVKQKDYKSYLEELIGEAKFRMLTNISFFPEKLDWKKRRQILIDMVGDVSDVDVINSNDDLKPLLSVIGDKSIDDLTTITKQRMTEINKQIKALPSRIDEVDRNLPDLSELNKGELEDKKQALLDKIEVRRKQISDIKNGLEVGNLKQEKQELQLHYKELEQEYNIEQSKQTEFLYEENKELNNQLIEVKTLLHSSESKQKTISYSIAQHDSHIKTLEDDNEVFREKFKAKKAEQIEPFDMHRTTCQTCGQEFPEDKLLEMQANYQKEIESFNTAKAKYLADINANGKENNEEIEKYKQVIAKQTEEIKVFDEEIESHQKSIKDIQDKIKNIGVRINEVETKSMPFKDTEEAKKITEQGLEINKKIEKLEENSSESITSIQAKISAGNIAINKLNDQLYLFTQYANLSKRKDELIEEEQSLSKEFGALEQREYLLEEFVRTKVNHLTDSINSQFKLVKFKLFSTNIDGGLVEVCEPTVDGANYSTGLNNAARINAGLDIVTTLMDKEDIKVPVFIDNSEGINEFIEVDTQLITLSVSKHKNLRVEAI